MPQYNNIALVAKNPAGANVALNTDANGNLLIASDNPATPLVPLAVTSGSVANASAVATLAAAASKTTYITGFVVTGLGATAVGSVTATLALSGVSETLDYVVPVPAGVTVGLTPLVVNFPFPLSSGAVNSTIVVTVPALGAGNTSCAVSATGYQQ